MERVRSPFQGVWNIVRFNWHFYVIAAVAAIASLLVAPFFGAPLQWLILLGLAGAVAGVATTLAISYWIYDCSPFYALPWLEHSEVPKSGRAVVINAGFDEISGTLRQRLPQLELALWDFYDPDKHTEVSIKRARSAYPPSPETQTVTTGALPMADRRADLLCLMMAAHEIRDPEERRQFFRELHRILSDDGVILVTEHLRDLPNFLAYSIGFFHFYSRAEWLAVFDSVGLKLIKEWKITPFVSTFILKKR